MKNKILSVLIASITALSLCACNKEAPVTSVSQADKLPVASDTQKDNDSDKVSDSVVVSAPDYLISYNFSSLVLLNDDGSVKDTISTKDLPGDFVAYANGYIFCNNYDYTDDSYYTISAKEISTGNITEITTQNDPLTIDINEDSLIITGRNFAESKYTESWYDLKTLAPTGTVNEYTFDESSLVTYSCRNDYNNQKSIYTLNKENGYIILNGAGNRYCKFADGVSETLPLLDNVANVFAYSKNGVLYSTYRDEYNYTISGLYYYDFDSMTNSTIEDESFYSFICCDGTTAYYAVTADDTYNLERFEIKSFDLGSQAVKSVTSASKQPGESSFDPGVTNSVAKGNRFYYLDANEGVVDWYVLEGESAACLNVKLSENPFADFGTIEAISRTVKCPNCGEKVMQYYGEYPVLKEGLFPAVAAINEFMKAQIEDAANASCEAPEYLEAPCEEHEQWYTKETDEENVADIVLLTDNLLTIDISGYWYGGGAHGMPSRNHFLFDTNTGASLRLKDIYSGTEEDYKLIVANKTVENFNSYSENDNPYFAAWSENGADEVFNQAYEEADINFAAVQFTKEGVVVEYTPYDMGPYAAGYIEVFISYEDLGIDINAYGK